MPWALIVVWALLVMSSVVDFGSALGVLEVEANPIYVLTGSMWVPLLIMLFSLGAYTYLTFAGKVKSEFWSYLLVLSMVFGILMHLGGAISNVDAAKVKVEDPGTYEYSAALSKEFKVTAYAGMVLSPLLFAVVVPVVGFLVWQNGRRFLGQG